MFILLPQEISLSSMTWIFSVLFLKGSGNIITFEGYLYLYFSIWFSAQPYTVYYHILNIGLCLPPYLGYCKKVVFLHKVYCTEDVSMTIKNLES